MGGCCIPHIDMKKVQNCPEADMARPCDRAIAHHFVRFGAHPLIVVNYFCYPLMKEFFLVSQAGRVAQSLRN